MILFASLWRNYGHIAECNHSDNVICRDAGIPLFTLQAYAITTQRPNRLHNILTNIHNISSGCVEAFRKVQGEYPRNTQWRNRDHIRQLPTGRCY